VHLFRLEEDLSMTPWLSATGATLSAGALPVAAVCH
jgi:hypothetical protein